MIGGHHWQKSCGTWYNNFVIMVLSIGIYSRPCRLWTTLDRAMDIYCCLYWAHVLIRHYLTTGKKYALVKTYVLNKHVHLLLNQYSEFTVPMYVSMYVCIRGWCNATYIYVCSITTSTCSKYMRNMLVHYIIKILHSNNLARMLKYRMLEHDR